MQYLKALPPLAFAIAIAIVAYAVFNPEPDVDLAARQQANAAVEAVNRLPGPPMTVGQPPDEAWISERVINLPEDGGAWHTVLVLDDSPMSRHVAGLFNTTPRLQSLAAQTKTYQYPPDHWWTQKNRPGYPAPLILVMRPSIEAGGTNDYTRVYEQWGSGIPADGERLADDIAKMIGRPCPRPEPAPTPVPQPLPMPPVAPVIPMTPDVAPPPESNELEWLIYALIAGGGLGGAGLGIRREFT